MDVHVACDNACFGWNCCHLPVSSSLAFLNMKRFFIAASFVLLTISLCAQQKQSFIGFQAGTSIPVGKYHLKELPDGGFAMPGFSASLEGTWFFLPWLGIGANAGINLHPVDAGALGEAKLKDSDFLQELTIRSDPYLSLSMYSGLYSQFPVAKNLKFTAKALGGIFYAQTPYQLYKAEYYMIGKNWYDITSAGDYEGSFLAGAGLRYDLNDCIGFALNSEFTYNQCEFDFITLDGNVRTENKVITFINAALGLVIKL